MNKFINILLLIILFPVIGLTIIVGFDIPVDFLKLSGANLPYKLEIFSALAVLIFLIGARRSIRRWMGVRMVNTVKRFQWNAPMNKNRYKQSILYLILEAAVHFFIAITLVEVSFHSWPVALGLTILGIDHLFFAFLSKKRQLFRVGITSKAILVADRDVKALYFSGLKKISKHQQSLFFDYEEDLQIAFPSDCISDSEKEEFKQQIEKFVDRDRVFFTESFKNF